MVEKVFENAERNMPLGNGELRAVVGEKHSDYHFVLGALIVREYFLLTESVRAIVPDELDCVA